MSFLISKALNNLSFETQSISSDASGNTTISGDTTLDSVVIKGPAIIKTLDNNQYNLQTTTMGNASNILQSDGFGGTYWGIGSTSGSGIVYNGSMPISVGQHIIINNPDGTTVSQSRINEGPTNLDIDSLNVTNANNIECNLLKNIDGNVLTIQANQITCADIETQDHFSVNYELQKIDNFLPSTLNNTNITGNVVCDKVLTDQVFGKTSNTTFIDFSTPEDIDVLATNFTYNGNQVATMNDIPTFDQSLNTGDNVSFNKVSTGTINATNLYPKVLSDLNIGTQNTDILRLGIHGIFLRGGDLYNVNINNANSFVKTGGTNQQYLMADGSSLQYSQNSGNSNFYLYNNTSEITTPPPSNGQVGYNNAIQANATILYISHRTRDNIDIDVFLAQLTTIQDVYIQDQENSLNYIRFNITGTPTIIPNNYISIPVLYTAPNGSGTGLTSFGNGHNILVSFFTNSVEVDTRLTTVENKTVNQTVVPYTSTTFKGDLLFKPSWSNIQALKLEYGTSINKLYSYQDTGSSSLCQLDFNASSFNFNGGDVNIQATKSIYSPKFIVPGCLSTQFLKGDGSIDQNTYLTSSSSALNFQGYILNPISTSTTSITSGNKSYFFTVRINRPTTINGFTIYLGSGSDPVRCGIYRNFIRGSPLSNATLVGQSNSTPAITGLPYLSGAILPVVGQNLNFSSGEYMIIGFGSIGSTNSYYVSSITGIPNVDFAFSSSNYYVAGGFPATLTTSQQSSTLINKLCLELY